MPRFVWKGIRIDGGRCQGIMLARTESELVMRLNKQRIAVVSCYKKKNWFVRSIRRSDIILLFKELGMLLNSGILISDALQIVEMQTSHPLLQEVVRGLYNSVTKGIFLHQAMQGYTIFDAFSTKMVHVGHENGDLATSLSLLSDHLDMIESFRSKLRSLAFMPLSTLIFFILISAIILIVIVPQFSSLFVSSGASLPRSTKIMLFLSQWIQSIYMPLSLLAMSLVGFFIYRWIRSSRYIRDRISGSMPLVLAMSKVQFFQSVALLLDGGVQLIPALRIVYDTTDNIFFANAIASIIEDVASGSSFSQALMMQSDFFDYHTSMIVYVGEEASQLSYILRKISCSYKQKIHYTFNVLTSLFQPFLLILLGLLVSWLVFSVYVPLFTLSQTVPMQ